MTTQVQFRKGTTSEHALFTGALAELTVDTDKKTAVVHDGSDIGGFELQRTRWEVVNTDTSLSCGLRWLIDTSASALSLTMPFESAGVVPHVGDVLELVDFKATWAINNVTLTASNGQLFLNKFGNTDSVFVLDVAGLYVQFIWDGIYWRILA
jgi:hypothetical protein|tara:strand:+ start:1830 stop:2288 length:459 start_codon:yes stop_codon:yes gene_type:complete